MANATNRWLDELAKWDRSKGGTGSDYKLAQLLEASKQRMSKWRAELVQMEDDAALKLAQLLDVHPLKVIGEVRSERSRDSRTKKFWLTAAKASAVILTAGSISAQTAVSLGELPFSASDVAGILSILC